MQTVCSFKIAVKEEKLFRFPKLNEEQKRATKELQMEKQRIPNLLVRQEGMFTTTAAAWNQNSAEVEHKITMQPTAKPHAKPCQPPKNTLLVLTWIDHMETLHLREGHLQIRWKKPGYST